MTGVILFRAQPFHNGHLYMIKKALTDCVKLNIPLYIFVGSADKSGTKRNPLPIDVRLDLIHGSIKEFFSIAERRNIYVRPLPDLSDEANNTHSWGCYLYKHLCDETNDKDFVFYYSDRPEIILSWFPYLIKDNIYFKFIDRFSGITATSVRENLVKYPNDPAIEALREDLPGYVYDRIDTIRKYIIESK